MERTWWIAVRPCALKLLEAEVDRLKQTRQSVRVDGGGRARA